MLQPLGKRIVVRDRDPVQQGKIIETANPAWLEGEILAVGWPTNPEGGLDAPVSDGETLKEMLEGDLLDRLQVGAVVLFSFRAGIVVEKTRGDKLRFLTVDEVMAVVDEVAE